MAGTCVRVLVILLCLFDLVCNNGAIPVIRSGSLGVKKSEGDEITEFVQNMESEEQSLSLEGIMRRMDAELNDYPGSGANNRHTPRPQLGRGCMDC